MAPMGGRIRSARRCAWLFLGVAGLLGLASDRGSREDVQHSWAFAAGPVGTLFSQTRNAGLVVKQSGAELSSMKNPGRTVSDTINTFYKEYPQPPVLPMDRSFLVDFMTNTHLTIVDARFKYDAVFALGAVTYCNGLMGSYDKLTGGIGASEKVFNAFCQALDMDPAQVIADAEAVRAYAKATPPGTILTHKRIADAFSGIGSSLYGTSFSIGLFTVMEGCGVDVNKDNVEEWTKALKVTSSKAASDLDIYNQNNNKLRMAEEMIREIEIREKKKLAECLEAKAKALAAKAAEKAAAAAAM